MSTEQTASGPWVAVVAMLAVVVVAVEGGLLGVDMGPWPFLALAALGGANLGWALRKDDKPG